MITIGSKKPVRTGIIIASGIVAASSVLAFLGSVLVLSQHQQSNLNNSVELDRKTANELLKLKSEEDISNAKAASGLAGKTNTLIIDGVNKSTLFNEARKNSDSLKSFNDGLGINITNQNRVIIGTFDGSNVCQIKTNTCIKLD